MSNLAEQKYSWEDRFNHLFDCYIPWTNMAIEYIAENFGKEELEEFFRYAMTPKLFGKSTFPTLKKGVGAEELLAGWLPHHLMIGSEVKIKKMDPNEIIVEITKCGSKSMLAKKFGSKAKYYCGHCAGEVMPLFEEIGWPTETILGPRTVNGQNIGCTRIFRKKNGRAMKAKKGA